MNSNTNKHRKKPSRRSYYADKIGKDLLEMAEQSLQTQEHDLISISGMNKVRSRISS